MRRVTRRRGSVVRCHTSPAASHVIESVPVSSRYVAVSRPSEIAIHAEPPASTSRPVPVHVRRICRCIRPTHRMPSPSSAHAIDVQRADSASGIASVVNPAPRARKVMTSRLPRSGHCFSVNHDSGRYRAANASEDSAGPYSQCLVRPTCRPKPTRGVPNASEPSTIAASRESPRRNAISTLRTP